MIQKKTCIYFIRGLKIDGLLILIIEDLLPHLEPTTWINMIYQANSRV